jgi:Zn-dependent M16 (insulinase) family peptidase
MKEVTAPYSVMEGMPTENQTFLTLSWVYGDKTDPAQAMALDILADVLIGQESAPIRTALQDSLIGKDVYAYNSADNQNTFVLTVKNANAEDKAKFKEVVLQVLKEQSEKGIDRDAVDAYINRLEFNMREGDDSQKGLMHSYRSFANWMFTDDPFVALEWEKTLAKVKDLIKENYLENLIKEAFLNNNHALLLSLEPKPGLEKEIMEKTTQELAEYKKSLTDEQLDALVKETKELIEYQQREDSAEALATIPKLGREDLNPDVDWYETTKKEAGTEVLHFNTFSNGVVYADLMFNVKVLPKELLPYASLMTSLLGKMDTENYKYGDLEKTIRKNTGTFYTNINTYKENYDDDKLIAKFIVTSKALPEKTDKMFELINEVLFKTKFNDKDRLKVILSRLQSRLESNVKNNGLGYAFTRTFSYYSNEGMFDEVTNGFEYYWFINDLMKDFDGNYDEIVANVAKTAELLFNKNNLITGTTCDEEGYKAFNTAYTVFVNQLPANEVAEQEWNFELKPKNEGFMSASKVQYVVKAYNFKKLGFDWNGKMMVMNNILSNDYLHNKIRVIGGAYGGFSGVRIDGTVYFGSYRDPNLKETLENYDAAPEFLSTFEADEEKMLGYIIGSIADLDYPRTPSEKGRTAYARYFRKYTKDMMEAERKAVLNTTAEDIKGMAEMIKKVLEQDVHCVYGNKEKITENKSLFGSILMLEKEI